ncbi:MAG: PAS domain S-box protein, partial [Chloroflexi bacterium]|nr:PAS domain S-box protein [Chloroflexota bacterium]
EATCVFVNDEFARIVGCATGELIGQSPPNTISPDLWRGRLKAETEKKATHETRPRIELDLVRTDGRTIPVDIGIGSTTYQNKPATVLYMTDISERRRQEAENLQLQETLRLYSNQVVKASKELLHAIREFHARESMVQAIAGQKLLKRAAVPPPAPVRVGEVELLTAREIQVLQLAARGLSNKDISAELGITVRTVKGHLINIYAKMNVRSRTEAVSCALKEGWIRLEDMGQGAS